MTFDHPARHRAALKKESKGSKFDIVVHDGAPNVGGAWSNEAYTQVRGMHQGPGRGHAMRVVHRAMKHTRR